MTARRSPVATPSRLTLTAEAFLAQKVRSIVEPVFAELIEAARAEVRKRVQAHVAQERRVREVEARPPTNAAPKPKPSRRAAATVPVAIVVPAALPQKRAVQEAFDFPSESAGEPPPDAVVEDPEALLAVAQSSARTFGAIKWFDAARGYGFLTSTTGEDAFVHCTAFAAAMPERPQGGFRVSYERSPGRRGLQAIDVRPA